MDNNQITDMRAAVDNHLARVEMHLDRMSSDNKEEALKAKNEVQESIKSLRDSMSASMAPSQLAPHPLAVAGRDARPVEPPLVLAAEVAKGSPQPEPSQVKDPDTDAKIEQQKAPARMGSGETLEGKPRGI